MFKELGMMLGEAQIESAKLKAENEELKKAYARLNSLYNDNCDFTGKLEQTLTEIKEIAEKYKNLNFGEQQYCCSEILQTINKYGVK